jgi:hypothetical protein
MSGLLALPCAAFKAPLKGVFGVDDNVDADDNDRPITTSEPLDRPSLGVDGWGALLQHAKDNEDDDGAAAIALINGAPGCDVGARDAEGSTLLMLAAATGLLGLVKALVGKGVEVDAADDQGWTALAHAMACKEEACAVYLLEGAGTSWCWTMRDPEGRELCMLGLTILKGTPRAVKAVVQRMRADGVDGKGLVERVERARGGVGVGSLSLESLQGPWRRTWT